MAGGAVEALLVSLISCPLPLLRITYTNLPPFIASLLLFLSRWEQSVQHLDGWR
jgi:hypothetical protein